MAAAASDWPELNYGDWSATLQTLHRWTQIAGKVRLALAPPVNHWWHVPLYLTARGLTTSPMPQGGQVYELGFDFIDHLFVVACSNGVVRVVRLEPKPTAQFWREAMQAMAEVGLRVKIRPQPSEIPDAEPLDQDETNRTYDREYAWRFWRALTLSERVMTAFRGRYLGKSSPVHFFWGSFDLAVTRFSGREAPPHPGSPLLPDSVTREAYSHEVSSAGFWPGGPMWEQAVFYAYAYPEPEGFADWPVRPKGARHEAAMGEFMLPYDAVRGSGDPEGALMEFLQTSYEAAADRGGWDRAALERR
ncbi:MAG TPA: DUF5996 family protein [Caulobacteraceae bacterium]|jgi:hypothetical protein